jgi:RHH-type rel operon transcriptional repressor/antitoxin RelB
MLSVRLPENMDAQLAKLCAVTKRSRSFYVKEALRMYLEDMEDTYIALERLADPHAKYYTNKEVKAFIEAMPDDE